MMASPLARIRATIKVTASGVNRADLLQAKGLYPPPAGAPETFGLECAGRLVGLSCATSGRDLSACPDIASVFHRCVALSHGPPAGSPLGTRVMALCDGGGYDAQVSVPLARVLATPPSLSDATAGGLVEGAVTVHSLLCRHGEAWLRGDAEQEADGLPPQHLLVLAASSHIGLTATAVCRARARVPLSVTGVVRNESKVAAVLASKTSAGADNVVVASDAEAMVKALRPLSKSHGQISYVLDCLGGEYLESVLDAGPVLAPDATWGIYGLMAGPKGTKPLPKHKILALRTSVFGSTVRHNTPAWKDGAVAAVRRMLLDDCYLAAVSPSNVREFPADDYLEAHNAMARNAMAKFVLTHSG